MLRWIHKVLALCVILPLMALVISGSILSVMPAWDRAGTIASRAISVADLASRAVGRSPGIEELKRLPSGKIIAFYSGNGGPAASVVDPSSGAFVSAYLRSGFDRWITNLHRSFLIGDSGRMATGAGALAMLVLTLSGLQMTARRMGGWRRILGRARGDGAQRLHADLGRLAALGLLLSTLTAIYLTLTTFGVIPDGMSQSLAFPVRGTTSGQALPLAQMVALRSIDLSQLRELTFPNSANPTDLFHLITASGEGYIDPAKGEILAWQDHSMARQAYEFIYMLHTGQGLWWLGLLLGVSALGVPALGVTGLAMWWRCERTRAPITSNTSAKEADTVILVGSEGGSTWGFARTLHAALTSNGHRVHTTAMGGLLRSYPSALRMFVLTATYGDGAAPGSARAFLKRLDAITQPPSFPVAVLGFGDRQFPQFCQFARDVESALARKGWASLMPLGTIDRRSVQEFARWGETLSEAVGEKVMLSHVRERPHTRRLTLIERIDYGVEVKAPTCVLRFALPASGALARYAAGDLIAVLPPDCMLPRYYSLASSSGDGFIEICVRKHPGGLCSGFLHSLLPGDSIEAFIKANPTFRPASGRKPVILIGAGTGIGPLAGFIRANAARRPMHLYFGGRDPASDFLYGRDIASWLDDKRLSSLSAIFSRVKGGGYVQDRLRKDADRVRSLISGGAQILVCGRHDMAAGVMKAMTDVLAPAGMTPIILKVRGRYAEDVY